MPLGVLQYLIALCKSARDDLNGWLHDCRRLYMLV